MVVDNMYEPAWKTQLRQLEARPTKHILDRDLQLALDFELEALSKNTSPTRYTEECVDLTGECVDLTSEPDLPF